MMGKALTYKETVMNDQTQRKFAMHQIKVILTIALRDLIRQVSVQCVERGALLEKVLSNYINIYETEMRGNLIDVESVKKSHLEAIHKTVEEREAYLNGLQSTNDKLNAENAQFREMNAKFKAN